MLDPFRGEEKDKCFCLVESGVGRQKQREQLEIPSVNGEGRSGLQVEAGSGAWQELPGPDRACGKALASAKPPEPKLGPETESPHPRLWPQPGPGSPLLLLLPPEPQRSCSVWDLGALSQPQSGEGRIKRTCP